MLTKLQGVKNKMKYAYFIGCQVPGRLNNYDLATRNVAKSLGIELIDLEDAGCCGFVVNSVNSKATLFMAARVLALARKMGLDLVTLCNGCFGTLQGTVNILKHSKELQDEVNDVLKNEGLTYENVTVKHFVQVLYHDYGLEKIEKMLKKHFDELKVAVHYGCHVLRPDKKLKFDNAETPTILDRLVEVTGAESIYWPLKLWCCGAPTLSADDELSMQLARLKAKDAKDAGADCFVTICPFCQLQLQLTLDLPSLLYPQLLGLAMNMSPEEVGLNLNRVPAESILQFLK